ncbi:MAG: oligosaccharide flippase family protein [Bacteroidota bacterium]
MNREFLINIAFLLGINLLIKPIYLFGIDRNVQNLVFEDYGWFATFWSFTFLFQIIADLGLQYYNNRQISQHRHLLNKYFPSLLVLKLGLSFFFIIVLFIAGFLKGYLQEYPLLFSLLAINQTLLSFLLYFRTNVSGLGYYRYDSFLSILDKLLMIVVLGVILWGGVGKDQFQIEWFALAQTFSLVVTILVAIILIRKRLTKWSWRIKWPLLRLILKESYPYALAVFLMTFYTRLDIVMIESLLESDNSIKEAAYYAAAYRLLDAANMIGYLFAALLLPMFSRMFKEGQSVNSLVHISIRLIWAGAIPLAIGVFVFQQPIMEVLYEEGNAYSGRILGWLMLSFIAITGTYIYGTLIVAHGSLMKLNWIYIISVILNVILNYIFIKSHKAEGAAFATLITQAFVLLAQIILAKRWIPLAFDIKLILIIGVYVLAILGLVWIIQLINVVWFLQLLLLLLASLMVSFVLKMIDLREVQHLMNNR